MAVRARRRLGDARGGRAASLSPGVPAAWSGTPRRALTDQSLPAGVRSVRMPCVHSAPALGAVQGVRSGTAVGLADTRDRSLA
eukprot:2030857-Alexandrium_andersonii.AAC.1